MNEHFTTDLACPNEACEHYLIPVEVEVVREACSTGASYLKHDDDWLCECLSQRQDVIEGVPETTRRRYAEVGA